ncbi:isoprenylcysteine carboxyl methyltransferase family protein [Peptostreptococcus anaerobius]|uniref:isoprenylcysteine carboxyl methyltransferase family protein n=1 Tax=Peptostreptococcus anaerobius TaxID=1261 RepID=UPI0007671349|nr:isoprenylcysteine carboxyl methyltransferase family protein [Peptostreptococcus anaerobius]MDU1175082.1 isoprenylcysteine carboxyl methyltransferase family protein [Peptostreptococcus anaerobius]MDU1233363.1 isoprenylcysteine carboxyl methyltransferase family protein [Peptostreptococcus anaerobius]
MFKNYVVPLLVVLIFVLRLYFLKISIKNEKKILKNGGKEFGVKNTKAITILHILFYVFCPIEAIIRGVRLDSVGLVGISMVIFSMIVLYTVISLLGDIWTVKLMLLKNHKYVDHWLFRTFKHPNYFLNIMPELCGIGLLCHAKLTSLVILPLYAIVLYKRISQENMILEKYIIPNR